MKRHLINTCTFEEKPIVKGWQIVAPILDRFRGLPARLAGMSEKSAEWYSSHGRESRTDNPVSSGNISPVDHYMRFVRMYEGGKVGAGRALNNAVHRALESEIADADADTIPQSELSVSVLDETCDVSKWLARFNIDTATRNDLIRFETDCDEAMDTILAAKARARLARRNLEIGVRA